jgi:hypothetical protein
MVADASAVERAFVESELHRTMVRPPELTDKPYTGKYCVCEGRLAPLGIRISRADVADFMMEGGRGPLLDRKSHRVWKTLW